MEATHTQPIDFGPLWRAIGRVIDGWLTQGERATFWTQIKPDDPEWFHARTVALAPLLNHRARLPELAAELRLIAADRDALEHLAEQLVAWFYAEAPEASRWLCLELLSLLGFTVVEAGGETTVAPFGHGLE